MNEIEKIVCHLMLKCADLRDISLYHGRTGIVFALYAYAQKKEDENLKEYAWDLLQTVYKGIYDNQPYGLEWGLAGIGYGVTLLKKYGIFDCDLNNVLYEIDQKIMAYDPRRISNFSFRNGALGIHSYLCLRQSVENSLRSFDTTYLHELQMQIQNNHRFDHEILHRDVLHDLQLPQWDISEYADKALGLDAGMAYFLLSYCDIIPMT